MRRSSRAGATNSLGSGRRCRGSRSRRITASRPKRRVLDVCRLGRPPRPPARSRHVLRARVPRPAGQDRALQEAHGLGDPVVLVVRQRLQRRFWCLAGDAAANRIPGRRVVRPQRLPSRRRQIFRTYFTSGRGVEALGSVWSFLDLTRLGRQANREDSPAGYRRPSPTSGWRRHDEYEDASAGSRRFRG